MLAQRAVPPGPLGPLRQRALGYDMIKAGDPNYPADFIPLYNKALLASNQPGAFEGDAGQALATKMQILNSQKRIYDQGLAKLPPAVAQSIVNQRSYAENQPQPSTLPPMPEGPSGQPDPGPDVQWLFRNQVQQNAPMSQQLQARKLLPQLMQLPGFAGFAGGDEI
jgi:hypothetical protein